MSIRRGKADDGLRRLLQDGLPKPRWWWTPIETGGTSGGVPDAHFLDREAGVGGWVESKKTDGWAVKLEPHQIAWHRVHSAPCRTFIAVRLRGVGSSEGKGDGLLLMPGTAVDVLASGGVGAVVAEGLHLGRWLGGPRSWDWAAIGEALRSHDFSLR